MEACLKYFENTILCREKVLRTLYSLIGNSSFYDEPIPPTLLLYGHIATGKSLIIESLLKYLDYHYSIINCIEHPTPKNLFQFILDDLTNTSSIKSSEDNDKLKCDNMMQFINHLQKINFEKPVIIVLDKCERLRGMNLLEVFVRLRELTGLNICTIFITDLEWDKCYTKMIGGDEYKPIRIFFPQYTKDEILEILFLYRPAESSNYSDDFYRNYLNLFLSVFYRFCRDINELRYMAKINFVKYIEPFKTGLCTREDNVQLLWRNISPIFKANLEVIYLRISSSDDYCTTTQFSPDFESTTKLALSFELPFYAKYLLIAAYLASHNPPKEDKRLFMKQKIDDGKKKKKRVNRLKPSKATKKPTGPRNFPLTRMLAIFCTIIDEKVDLNANLIAQISTMCRLGLLTTVGGDYSDLDEPKFKCNINYDFIAVIAKTVGFTIRNYLCDFIN
ncbi:origin recognition complex subunit 5 [Chelonus insularis]|uniref:origin recognition complex subunit 5 n=1 Tax=Chelonus insularis TaxID=460826 RepID=UPI0015891F1B|nr:origin recognition complex subunit 5 [Chelonus insularis]